MATLSVTDNADGTWLATLSGALGGETRQLLRAAVTGGVGPLPWVQVGVFLGNDEAAGAADPGYYLWMADSAEDGVTATDPVYQPVTSGADSLHERIQAAALARCQLLDLPGVRLLRRQKLPTVELDGGELPCVLLVTFQTSEQDDAELSTNARDGTSFPVYVVFARQGLWDDETDAADTLVRQRVRRAFRNQQLPGVAEVEMTLVEFGPVLDIKAQDIDLQLGSMVLRFRCREPRGLIL